MNMYGRFLFGEWLLELTRKLPQNLRVSSFVFTCKFRGYLRVSVLPLACGFEKSLS